MNTLHRLFLSLSPILVFTVVGKSMEPTFREGEKVIALRYFHFESGDVLVVKDPRTERLLLKRVVVIKDEVIFIQGDNKNASTDSRHFGPILKKNILGKVIYPQR